MSRGAWQATVQRVTAEVTQHAKECEDLGWECGGETTPYLFFFKQNEPNHNDVDCIANAWVMEQPGDLQSKMENHQSQVNREQINTGGGEKQHCNAFAIIPYLIGQKFLVEFKDDKLGRQKRLQSKGTLQIRGH